MEQNDLLRFVVVVLDRNAIPYMVVGSYASLVLGEPRFTLDIDIVIDLKEQQVEAFCAAFPPSEFYLSEAAVRDGIRRQIPFNLIHPATANKVDFSLPRTDEWGRLQMERRQKVLLLPDQEGYTASPEDIIIGKMWYYDDGGSEKHLRDIKGILHVSGEAVDREYVAKWAGRLGYGEIWKTILEAEGKSQ